MKKHTHKRSALVALLAIAYLALGFFMTNLMANRMSKDYFDVLGTKGLDLARMAAAQLTITDADVSQLKNMSYGEMMNHPLNQQLAAIFESKNFSKEVKYVYLWTILEEKEIKYRVKEGEADYYNAEPGTPLDLMWLLDVTVNSEEALALGQMEPSYYLNDQNRYTLARPYDFELKNKRKETFYVDENEYGKVIVAYFPIYTVEENFVGCLNVDIYYDVFETHIRHNRINFSLLFIIPTMILTVIYLTIYLKRIKSSSIEVNTDPMTRLFNRRFLDKQFPKILKEVYHNKSCLSVIMLDIDFFKNYNDNYGHKAGDEVIIQVANAIKSVTRNGGDYVCRYGGEEIFILMPNTSAGGAEFVAQKIQNAINHLSIIHDFSNAGMVVTVSQGIYSQIPEEIGVDVCNMYIERADTALYQAKTSGRNKFVMYEVEEESLIP